MSSIKYNFANMKVSWWSKVPPNVRGGEDRTQVQLKKYKKDMEHRGRQD